MAIYDKHFDGYRIFVGDLARQATRFDVENEFGRYGKLIDVWVARNPPGFAFLVFKSADDCERAVRRCHGSKVCGRRIRVEFARPFDDRSSSNSRRQSGPNYQSRARRSRSYSKSRSRSPRRRFVRRRRTYRMSRSRSHSRGRNVCYSNRARYSRSASRSCSRSPSGAYPCRKVLPRFPPSTTKSIPLLESGSASLSKKPEAVESGAGDI